MTSFTLTASQTRATECLYSRGCAHHLQDFVALVSPSYSRFHVVIDSQVGVSQNRVVAILRSLSESGLCTLKFIRGGEAAKSTRQLWNLVDTFDAKRVARRSEPIVALGGGSVLDVVSLAASIYRRGVPHIRVPTTLLAMVDAGLAAKTAINFHGRKNLIGTFSPPEGIMLDPALLGSLPRHELGHGLAEILKLGIAADRHLFEAIEHGTRGILAGGFSSSEHDDVLLRAVESMTAAIWPDLWEDDLNRATDFGHSISKELEARLDPRPSHGDAVALDMAICIATSRALGLLDGDSCQRMLRAIASAGLPIYRAIDDNIIAAGIADTRVHRDGGKTVPLPDAIGHVVHVDVTAADLCGNQQYLRTVARAADADRL